MTSDGYREKRFLDSAKVAPSTSPTRVSNATVAASAQYICEC